VPGRSTVRVELRQPDGRPLRAYLKRYEPEYLKAGKRMLRRLGWQGAGDEAMREWNAILALRAAGFATAQAIALGQERRGGMVRRSFLLTAEIHRGVAAHDYARTLDAGRRRQFAREVGDLTRRFHRAGFAHRDLYLSHIFVVPAPAGGRELFLIDLQRLFRPRLFRRRWLVKDLAQLGYTAQLAGGSRTDLLRFYHAYVQKPGLAREDKRLLRRVARRIAALHARPPKYDVIWDRPGVRPPNV
jgi:hypothetical protein